MYYLIYKITNKLNNKIYIGAHKTKNKEDDYFGSGLLLERAVDKHSQQNFVKEILFELPTKEEMWQKEAEIVNEAFISRDDTYNIKLGGCGGFDYINKNGKNIYKNHSEIAKNTSKNNFLHGIDLKNRLIKEGRWESYKKKLSDLLKSKYKKEKFHWTGRHHKHESKIKIGENSKIYQHGTRNSQYGVKVIYNEITGERKRLRPNETMLVGWIYSKDRKKIKKENLKSIKDSRKAAQILHDVYINSNSKSLREFCRSGKYNKSVQALIMFWKRNIPDIYKPIQGKSYK